MHRKLRHQRQLELQHRPQMQALPRLTVVMGTAHRPLLVSLAMHPQLTVVIRLTLLTQPPGHITLPRVECPMAPQPLSTVGIRANRPRLTPATQLSLGMHPRLAIPLNLNLSPAPVLTTPGSLATRRAEHPREFLFLLYANIFTLRYFLFKTCSLLVYALHTLPLAHA